LVEPTTSSGSEPAAVATRASSPGSALAAVVVSLRPRQWSKNLFVFAGLVFAQQLFTPAVLVAAFAFVIFCGLSSAVYLFNDIADRNRDLPVAKAMTYAPPHDGAPYPAIVLAADDARGARRRHPRCATAW